MQSSAEAYNALQNYKQLSSNDAISQAENKYGVNDSRTRLSGLKSLVGNLQTAVENVDPSVTGRTSGTFTTEGQRQALVNKEQQPILTNLGKQQQAYGEEQQNLNTSQGLASQMASALIADDTRSYQRLLDQYNSAVATEQAAREEAARQEQMRQWQVQQAESVRQFNENMALQRSQLNAQIASARANIPQPTLATPTAAEKRYIGNDDYRGRLAYEAAKGNNDAAVMLRHVGNNGMAGGAVDQSTYNILKKNGVGGNYYVAHSGVGRVSSNMS